MKRILLFAAMALPAATLAAVPAPINVVVEIDNYNARASPATSYLNLAQCDDSAAPKVKLEWNIPGAQSGTYRIYASDKDPSTNTGNDLNFCLETDTSNPDNFAGQVGTSVNVQSPVQQGTFSGVEISAEASPKTVAGTKVCDTDGKAIWVCAHWYNSQGTRSAAAVGRFTVQLAAPDAPTGVSVGAGPGLLTVSWTAPTGGAIGADRYIAFARPLPDGSDTPDPGAPTIQSDAVNGTGPVEITGLQDGTRYRVVVIAYSVGGNPSPDSLPAFGTPTPVDAFWNVYENAGGREQGGCGAGGAGPVALLAVAGLLAVLRRRK